MIDISYLISNSIFIRLFTQSEASGLGVDDLLLPTKCCERADCSNREFPTSLFS